MLFFLDLATFTCAHARANLNFQTWRINVFTRCARTWTTSNATRKPRRHWYSSSMNFAWNIFFALITAFISGPIKIYSQRTNSTSSSMVCSSANNCENCVLDSACFWCAAKLLCKVYGATNKEVETNGCGEWKWKSCDKPEPPIVPIVSAAISAVLIIGRYPAFILIQSNENNP